MNVPFPQLSVALFLVFISVTWAGCGGGDDTTPPIEATPVLPTFEVTRQTIDATPTLARPTPVLVTATTHGTEVATPPPVSATTSPVEDSPGRGLRGPAGPAGASGPSDPVSPEREPAPTASTASEAEAAERLASESRPASPASAATAAPAPTAAPVAAMSAGEDSSDDPVGEARGDPYQVPSLSAGEVDDNELWEEYLEYLEGYGGPFVHKVDVLERYVISVTDRVGRPVSNAVVAVSADGQLLSKGQTYSDGRTLFFPDAQWLADTVIAFDVLVEKNGVSRSLEFGRGKGSEWQVTLDVGSDHDTGVPLDVLFLLDSTGSMADEIDQIKRTLLSISARVSDLPSHPDLRFGMVSYRDREDEYVTRLFDFDADVGRFANTIRNVVADGGGDEPESLNEALHVAIQRPEWRTGDAIRLVFLLADAPPHLDYADDYNYAVEMIEARNRGIKIFSVASSGLNAQGEYIFRQIAQHTLGRFIFLLYPGHSEGLGTSHSVSEYTVERLDDLVVRLIREELAVMAG